MALNRCLTFCDLAACFSALSKLQVAIVTLVVDSTIVSNCKSRGVALAVLYYSPVTCSKLLVNGLS